MHRFICSTARQTCTGVFILVSRYDGFSWTNFKTFKFICPIFYVYFSHIWIQDGSHRIHIFHSRSDWMTGKWPAWLNWSPNTTFHDFCKVLAPWHWKMEPNPCRFHPGAIYYPVVLCVFQSFCLRFWIVMDRFSFFNIDLQVLNINILKLLQLILLPHQHSQLPLPSCHWLLRFRWNH